MNFASKYVLHYETPEYEYVSDDEYDMGMEVSDEEDDFAPPTRGYIRGDNSYLGEKSDKLSPLKRDSEESDAVICNEALPESSTSLPPAAPPPPPACLCSGFGPPPHPLGSTGSAPRVFAGFAPKKSKTKGAKKHHWRSAGERSATRGGEHPTPPPLPKGRRFRRADTNVVSLKFGQLKAPSSMHAGDSVHCNGCHSIFSHISQLTVDGPDKVWTCEFCNERNLVDIEEEEKPAKDDVTFLVEPALSTAASGPSGLDESLVIFCIDVSGSMCVTTEVPGVIKLRGSEMLQKMQSFNDDRSSQYLPHQKRNVTYVSRLQSVQAAVDHQLQEMVKDHPNRRVALITFNNEVEVIGDGTGNHMSIVGDKLTDVEALTKLGSDTSLPKPIKDTRKCLGDKIFNLEEGGGTALGPALAVAVTMASGQPGSKVILCTDGMANVGLGKLDSGIEEVESAAQDFYEEMGSKAMEKGVAISVITIKGTDCKLLELGKMADRTGGQVNIVDPMKLTQEFSTILADRILATNVIATFIVHKDLFVFDEEDKNNESKAIRQIGNVTRDSEVTFEYGVRHKKKEAEEQTDAIPEDAKEEEAGTGTGDEAGAGAGAGAPSELPETADPELPKELPFQLQISYTDMEGNKALRVFTQKRPVTTDRNLAERDADLEVLGIHAAQKTAALALCGDYTRSRGAALMNQRLAWRSANSDTAAADGGKKKAWYRNIFKKIQSVENRVTTAQISEKNRLGGITYSDDEDDCEEVVAAPAAKKKSKLKKRSKEINDDMASDIYRCNKASSKSLLD